MLMLKLSAVRILCICFKTYYCLLL